MLERQRRRLEDGQATRQEHVRIIVHKDTYSQINFMSKSCVVNQGADYQGFLDLPTQILGVHLPGIPPVPLSSLIGESDVSRIEGTEEVDGVETVVVRTGEGWPRKVARGIFSEEGVAKLWLAPSLGYLPMRAEFDRTPEKPRQSGVSAPNILLFELADYRAVPDEGGGEPVLFPFSLRMSTIAAIHRIVVHEARVQVKFPTSEFEDPLPDGFVVQRDGKLPEVDDQGETEVAEDRIRQEVEKAKDLIEHVPPAASQPSFVATPRFLVPVGLTALVVVLVVFRRMQQVT